MLMPQDSASDGDKKLPPQPFANYALDYHDLGLAIVPCEGKTPKVSWKKYQTKKPSVATIYRWLKLYPAINIGLVTGGISGIVVIDCDNPNLSLAELEFEFGESKFAVATPSGGKHLYYKFDQEASKTRFRDGIDVKGEGGLIIAPNSFNGEKNAFYKIIKGELGDLNNLTSLKLNLKKIERVRDNSYLLDMKPLSIINGSEPRIPEGERGNYLFYQLKETADNYKNYQSFVERAFEINIFCFVESLAEKEVERTAENVWKKKENGTLFRKGEGFVTNKYEAEVVKLRKEPRAYLLLSELKYYHLGVRKVFCITQDEMSKKLGWSKKSLRRAIEILMKKKFILRHETKNEKKRKNSKIKTLAYQYSFWLG